MFQKQKIWKDRLEEIAMEGFLHIQNLGNILETRLGIPEDKQLPRTSCLAPYVVDDEAFPLQTYLKRLYPGSQSKGDNEKSICNYRLFWARRVVENVFGILRQKFQIYQRTLQSLPENEDNIIFATCILHNYLTDQGVGLSDMRSSGNVRSNLTKISNQGGSAHQSSFEVRDKFKQFFNSPSGSVPWQNERVQCRVNLQYSTRLDTLLKTCLTICVKYNNR